MACAKPFGLVINVYCFSLPTYTMMLQLVALVWTDTEMHLVWYHSAQSPIYSVIDVNTHGTSCTGSIQRNRTKTLHNSMHHYMETNEV